MNNLGDVCGCCLFLQIDDLGYLLRLGKKGSGYFVVNVKVDTPGVCGLNVELNTY